MQWITRERSKIERLACPWLILRFIDPQAEIAYVPAPEVVAPAERIGAIAFDGGHGVFPLWGGMHL
ncbi:chromate resistance protein ChrB domain-containing protein [Hymenobacter sp. BT188]|uniref:chromate resistance protein ChrB domain-containing protein n=1 Tax=Hymenobacter sp. BT188 TaxID=2763504 RepID=UPI0021C96952|nr:chromate resistance protein ChrB domain-containing protein [Hymenobacter sp. BT188]